MRRIYLILLLFSGLISTVASFKTEASFYPEIDKHKIAKVFQEDIPATKKEGEKGKIEKEIVVAKKFQYHNVRSGETLSRISRRYGVSIEEIVALNPSITNIDLIITGEKLVLAKSEMMPKKGSVKKNRTNASLILRASSLSIAEKMVIVEDVAKRTGLPWQVLAGLTQQESGFGVSNIGDDGNSIGPFQIHLPSHPEVKREQAMDFRWSANWAGNYLLELGAKQDLMRALRLWNGSCKNPKTLTHAKNVMHWAKNKYGYKLGA